MLNYSATPDQDCGPDGISGWGGMPLSMVIGQHGIGNFEESLALLKQMTKISTSDVAVCYFLVADQERAVDVIRSWNHDSVHDLRRLVSEGTRPRLPWAMQLPPLMADPSSHYTSIVCR